MHDAGQERPAPPENDEDSVKWLALLLRQSMKLFIAGVDARYGKSRTERERRERCDRQQGQRAA